MYCDFDNNARVLWRDLNTDTAATTAHPINTWTNASITIPGVNHLSDISYNTFLIFQGQDDHIVGYQLNLDAENSAVVGSSSTPLFRFDEASLPGTKIWTWGLNISSNDPQLSVFHQVNGSDITQTTRDLNTGQYASNTLPVPN
jgi:hypothetical protein